MIIPQQKLKEMLAYEAFIRRAALLDMPFMLKGSYITRQYFQNPTDRIPADLDWVYLEKISDPDDARIPFGQWVTDITEMKIDDGVVFRSFEENAFWRMIDYAMDDDFPTVSTDIKCWVDGEEMKDFILDISFNLDIDVPPVPLQYQPIRGTHFMIPNTVPLALQVSWKLHQTLVRPRFKDLFDLIHLVQHPGFNEAVLHQTLLALVNECSVDGTDVYNLNYLLSDQLENLFVGKDINQLWDFWRYGKQNMVEKPFYDSNLTYVFSKAEYLTDVLKLPETLAAFRELFSTTLKANGFDENLLNNLPEPTNAPHFFSPDDDFVMISEYKPPKPVKPLSFMERIRRLFR